MSITCPRHESILQLLFFPTESDIADGSLSSKLLQLPHHYMQTASRLPPMKTAHRINSLFVRTRRPGFLEILNEEEYCDVFKYLLEHPELTFLTWEDMHQSERHIQKIFTLLMGHVVTWFKSDWTFPERAGDRRKLFQWATEFREVVLIGSPLEESAKRGYADNADLIEVSEKVLRVIWSEVEQNSIWSDKRVITKVRDPGFIRQYQQLM